MRRTAILAVALVVVCASVAGAQGQEPVGPFVVDARGLMGGLPTAGGWLAPVPTGTIVPSRGFGLEFGAHVYPLQWGPARVGFGAALGFARGTATAAPPTDTTTPAAPTPDVVTRSRTFAPQVSLNFGQRLGWSYLSFGYGAAKIASEAAAFGTIPAAESDSGWTGAINFGGGARWFITDRVGVGFDARWHRLSGREASLVSVAAPRATLFHLGVGVTIH